MIFVILILVAMATFFGAPALPTILVGAFCQSLGAYVLTRNPLSLAFSFGPIVAVIGQYVLFPAFQSLSPDMADFLPAFTLLSYVLASVSLVGATLVGLLGMVKPSGESAPHG